MSDIDVRSETIIYESDTDLDFGLVDLGNCGAKLADVWSIENVWGILKQRRRERGV